MRDIETVNLRELVPDSIRDDPNISAAIDAINGELRAVSQLAEVPAIIARINELTSTQLDHLAWQYDSKVYRDTWPINLKRSVIRRVILEKRKKGTRFAVEKALESLGSAVQLREWWETSPAGTPHTFSVTVSVADVPGQSDADVQNDIILKLNDVKPVRSHYTLNFALEAEGTLAFVGAARAAAYVRLNTVGSLPVEQNPPTSQLNGFMLNTITING